MMQEEELVNDRKNYDYPETLDVQVNRCGHAILPFPNNDAEMENSRNKYKFTLFEMFVTGVIMLNTISGGYLEGYTSPALLSLLVSRNPALNNMTSINTSDAPDSSTSIIESDTTESLIFNSINTTEKNPKANETDILNATFVQTTSPQINAGIDTTVFSDLVTSATSVNETLFPSTMFPEMLPSPLPISQYLNDTLESQQTFSITEEEGSWVGSLLLLGAAFGAALSPWIISLGRRHAIIFSAFPRLLGWILIIISTSVHTVYVGRFICGLSIGVISSASPIYMSEISHPSLRGSLNCIVILGANVGIFVAALLGTFLEWRGLAVCGTVGVVTYLVPSWLIPNSPSWLAARGRHREARATLTRLRGPHYAVDQELEQILSLSQNTNAKESSISWRDLFVQQRSALPLAVVALVTVVNRFSGYNAIITYCSLFIHQIVPGVSEYWAAVAVCLVQIVSTGCAMFVVDSWGRRKLLVSSAAVMGLSLLAAAACESLVPMKSGGTWVAVLSTMVYVSAYSAGVGPLTWVLVGELFPLDAREKASAVVATLNWVLAFVVTKTYFSLEAGAGVAGACLVYAGVCLVGAGLVLVCVPETKGRSLAEIEAYFAYARPLRAASLLLLLRRPPAAPRDVALSAILDHDAANAHSYTTFHSDKA